MVTSLSAGSMRLSIDPASDAGASLSSLFSREAVTFEALERPSFDSVFHGNLFVISALVSPLCSYIVPDFPLLCNPQSHRIRWAFLVQMGEFRMDSNIPLSFFSILKYNKNVEGSRIGCPLLLSIFPAAAVGNSVADDAGARKFPTLLQSRI